MGTGLPVIDTYKSSCSLTGTHRLGVRVVGAWGWTFVFALLFCCWREGCWGDMSQGLLGW